MLKQTRLGLTLGTKPAGESDVRIKIFFKDQGINFIHAKGAKRPKSKFLSLAQPYVYGEFIIAEKGRIKSLAGGEVIENFSGLANNYEALCCAARINEICASLIPFEASANAQLSLALKALRRLSKGGAPIDYTLAVYVWRFIKEEGRAPNLEYCVYCGANKTSLILVLPEGLVCENCKNKNAQIKSLSFEAFSLLKNLLETSESAAFNAYPKSENARAEIIKLVDFFFQGLFREKLFGK